MWTTDVQILIFSVYIPLVDLYRPAEETPAQSTLDKIQSMIQQAIQGTDRPTRIILAGDFNRHHPAWDNNQVHHVFIRQAAELINFFPYVEPPVVSSPGNPNVLVNEPPGEDIDN